MGLNALHLKLVLLLCTAAAAAPQMKPGCNNRCGNVSIPYPFGTSENCYIDEFFSVNCTTTTSPSGEATTQLIYGDNIPALNISLDPPQLTVSADVSYHCYDSSYSYNWIRLGKFSISNTENRFTVVGCDTNASIEDLMGNRFQTGCTLKCSNKLRFENGACSGVGCCQTSFPKAIRNYRISLSSDNNYTDVRDFNPCGYAFIAKVRSFEFSYQDLLDLRKRTEFPVVMDWAVGNQTCLDAQKDLSSYAYKQNIRC